MVVGMNRAPTPEVAIQETRAQIRRWLTDNASLYARQALKPGDDWREASIACRDVMLQALAACEQRWANSPTMPGGT